MSGYEDMERRFPTEALPEVMQRLVSSGAQSIQCSEGFVALPMLVTAGAAIGNAIRLQLKDGYWQYPILWGALVGASGCGKSPALNLAMDALHDAEEGLLEDAPRQIILNDATIESVGKLLHSNPRGMLLHADELSGWVRGFDKYKHGSGGDSAHWISMYDSKPIRVDRVTRDPVRVRAGSVAVIGGVQPGVLRRLQQGEHGEDGLLGRLLFVRQWRQSTRWTEEGIGEEERRSWSDTVLGLAQFQSARGQEPHTLHLSKSAKRSWSAYYDRLGEEMDDADEALAEFLTKLRPACGRLAIVLHTVEALSVGSGNAVLAEIGNETIDRAIALAEFFASQGRAVLAEIHGSRLDRSHRALVEWMKSRNCAVTAREAARGLHREFRSITAEAERALLALVEENVVAKQYTNPSEKGGRQTATYRLSERSS